MPNSDLRINILFNMNSTDPTLFSINW